MITGYDEIPPDHKQEQKTENTPADNSLTEWAEKIYRASEKVWKKLLAFQFFPEAGEAEKFRNEMHGKNFGKFVSVFQSNAGLLYLKIGDYEMSAGYYPSHHHIEKIKKFLSEQGEKNIDIAQQILMQIATIPVIARMVRGKILYPEIEKMESEIMELKMKMKEIVHQTDLILSLWSYSAKDIESTIMRGNPLFYATRNKIEKWRREFKETGK